MSTDSKFPQPLANPNITAIIAEAKSAVEDWRDTHEDSRDDIIHAVFDTVIEAVYGPDIWNYINAEEDEEE